MTATAALTLSHQPHARTLVNTHGASGVQEISWLSTRSSVSPLQSLDGFVARNVHQLRTESVGGVGHHRLRTYSVAGFTLLHAVAVGASDNVGLEIRDRHAIDGDGKDRFVLMRLLSGERRVSQLGRCQSVKAGTSSLFCTSEPYTIETMAWKDQNEVIAFFMPSDFVNQRIGDGKQYCVRNLTSNGNLHDLVAGTFELFARDAWKFSEDEFYKSARAIADLALLGLNAPSGAGLGSHSARLSNLTRVKQIMRQRMEDPDLTLADIAHAAGFSLNYVHNLFRGERQTLYQYLKAERLQRAREQLQLAKSRGMTVTEVALRCGFSDSSYFSRSFKQAFGQSPRDVLRLC
jgi:AraC-like DNA-binding protein